MVRGLGRAVPDALKTGDQIFGDLLGPIVPFKITREIAQYP